MNLKAVNLFSAFSSFLKKLKSLKYYFFAFFKPAQRYNSMNLEFFNSNYDNKSINTDKAIKHHEKNTYFKNVHLFVNKIRNMINSRDFQFIKNNL